MEQTLIPNTCEIITLLRTMYDVTIITPTTGNPTLHKAISSVQEQTTHVRHLIVVDGPDFIDDVHEQMPRSPLMPIDILVLPENTGRRTGDYYGHRIYSGVPALINTPYISFLDEDNWIKPAFVQEMRNAITHKKIATCRRTIYAHNEMYITDDTFESIGDNGEYILYDTNTYMFNRMYYVNVLAHAIYGEWGADRSLSLLVHDDANHIHIDKHLSCYRAPNRLEQFFKQQHL